MPKLSGSFIYKGFKKVLISKLGKSEAEHIWKYADGEYTTLMKQYRDVTSDEKLMILPLYAIYKSMKNNNVEEPLAMLKDYAVNTGRRMSKIIHGITSVPFVSKLLWMNMPKLMRANSSPEKGYERRILSESKDLVGVDILKCPLHELTKKFAVPELASVVCIIDKGQMTGFKYIDYARTLALGDGDEYCDYRLKYNKEKK